MSVEIKAGQLWRDKDKRRTQDGNIREFMVTETPSGDWVKVRTVERRFEFHRRRFGSGRANDSFELVSE